MGDNCSWGERRMNRDVKIRARQGNWNANVGLYGFEYGFDEAGHYARDAVFANVTIERLTAEDYGRKLEPFVRLEKEQAQLLMDDLWNCGIRPTEGAGSAGAMAATERHLEDMRKLVFEGKK